MSHAGELLARAQYASHIEIDGIYAGITKRVKGVVTDLLPITPEGAMQLDPLTLSATLEGINRVLRDEQLPITNVLLRSVDRAVKAANVAAGTDVPTTLPTPLILEVGLRQDRSNVLSQISQRLHREANKGSTPQQAAASIGGYFNPTFSSFYGVQPTSTARGLPRDPGEKVAKSYPGQAGMASQGPRGMMQALTGSYHGQTMKTAAGETGRGLQWTLSYLHRDRDRCDEYANQDVGYGAGIYAAGEEPDIPQHYRCRCYYEVVDLGPRVFAITVPEEHVVHITLPAPPKFQPVTVPPGITIAAHPLPAVPPPPPVPAGLTPETLGAYLQQVGIRKTSDVEYLHAMSGDWVYAHPDANKAQVEGAVVHEVATGIARAVKDGIPPPSEVAFIYDPVGQANNPQMAAYFPRSDVIKVNLSKPETWVDPAKVAKMSADNWVEGATRDSILVHEMGHKGHTVSLNILNPATGRIELPNDLRTWEGVGNPGTEKIRTAVSEYGATNPGEFVAETYTGIQSGARYDPGVYHLYRDLGGPMTDSVKRVFDQAGV